MNYNLYRGGSDMARRQVLIARLAESRQKVSRASRVVEEQARLSWNALYNGRDRVEALRSAVQANEVVRTTYREQFDLNQRSLLDLLDSENDLFIAKANLVSSEFAVMFGTYRVLANTGRLLAALNVEPPPEAIDAGVDEPAPANLRALPVPKAETTPVPAPQVSSQTLELARSVAAPDGTVRRASPAAVAPAVPVPSPPAIGRASAATAGIPYPPPGKQLSAPKSGIQIGNFPSERHAEEESAVPLYWGFN